MLGRQNARRSRRLLMSTLSVFSCCVYVGLSWVGLGWVLELLVVEGKGLGVVELLVVEVKGRGGV